MTTNEAEPAESVQELVSWLTETAKMTPQEIAEAMNNRVSSRTIYRWGNNESQPGNKTDYDELAALVGRMRSTG